MALFQEMSKRLSAFVGELCHVEELDGLQIFLT